MIFLQPERWFLFFSLLFGLLFALLTPPFQVPDEQDHFFTAYAISQGQSRQSTVSVPVSLVEMWDAVKDLRFNFQARIRWDELETFSSTSLSGQQEQISLYNTRFYSSILYFPQAAGVFISKELGLSTLIVFWTGRIFALLFWLSVMYVCLRIAPTFKWLLMFLMLTPISLYVGVSYSADSVTNAIIFLAIGIFLKAASPDWESIDLKRALILMATFIPLIFVKFPYVTQIALVSLIPFRKYQDKRYLFYILLTAFFCLGLWFLRVNLTSNAALFENHENTPGNLPQQLSFILSSPIYLLKIFYTTISELLGQYLLTFVGILGWFSLVLPSFVYFMYYIVLLFLSLLDHRKDFSISRFSKSILVATSILVFFELITIFYLSWTPVAYSFAQGVQGRYFLPFAPLLCLAFYNLRYSIRQKWLGFVSIIAIFLILSVSSYCIFIRYYS